MPNTKSAKKRMRQNEGRRMRNRAVKSSLRTQLRKIRAAVAGGQLEQAEQDCRALSRKLDRAGAHRIIHRNAASRTKSRLQKLLKNAKQAAASPTA